MTDGLDHYDVRVGVDRNLRAELKLGPDETPGGVALVEHTLPPGKLAAPLHRHTHEDEVTYVLDGEMGVREGDAVRTVGAGDVAVKERDTWHTFWNPGPDTLCFLEVISPGEFAGYFAEAAAIHDADLDGPEVRRRFAALHDAYGFELDPESVPELIDEHGLDG